MLYTEGTRPLSWYADQAPPDEEETEEEIKEHNRQITSELDAWCRRTAKEAPCSE